MSRRGRFGSVLLLLLGSSAMIFALAATSTERAESGASRESEAESTVSHEIAGDEVRRFRFEYEVEIPPAMETGEPITVFLPIATDATGQRILDVSIDSEFKGGFETDPVHGNRYWQTKVAGYRAKPTSIVVRYDIERWIVRSGDDSGSDESAKTFLGASDRVVVDHPVLTPILDEIRANSKGADAAGRARAIYDWVVDNVEYKKVGTGWGNGDTFWACSERYGNCTDFHSLFISLARTEGIPARFQMGFPIPADRKEGIVGGYHCWVEFWLPEIGWIPIDASEAYKHPEKRELFYGTHPADRVKFTTGRDLRLGPQHRDRALNYFIYPYVEVAGKRSAIEIRTRFRYRELARS